MKKILILAIYFSLPPVGGEGWGGVAAQKQNKIDSLLSVLKTLNEDDKKVNLLNTICQAEYDLGQYADEIKYAEQAVVLAEKIGYKKGLAKAYHSIGVVYWHSSEFNKALEFYFKALPINKEIKDKEGIAWDLGDIGLAYLSLSNYAKGLKYYQEALTLNEDIGRKDAIAWNFVIIGDVYTALSDYNKAMEYYQKALKLLVELGDRREIANAHTSIGENYLRTSDYNNALDYFGKALKIYKELGLNESIARTLCNFGEVYSQLADYPKAFEYFEKALMTQNKNKFITAKTSILIGEVYQKQGNQNQALKYEKTGLETALIIGDKELIQNAYKNLADIDSSMGNLSGAFENQKRYMQYKDSIFNIANSKIITSMQMQYDFDKKESIAKSEAENKLRVQRIYIFGGLFVLVIVTVLLFFVFRNYKKQKKANKILKETQQQLIESEKLAAFGAVATRVAHEILNPINFVNNFSQLSKDLVSEIVDAQTDEEKNAAAEMLRENLEKINHHGKRADDIVKQLFEHTRKGTAQEYFEEDK